jgi:phage terminase large subunit GpA-like protein
MNKGENMLGEKNATCEVCGNTYDKCFEVRMGDQTHVFDSFECAIHALAPTCAHCGCKIMGHGVETGNALYCCVHCASQHGIHDLEDRVEEKSAV